MVALTTASSASAKPAPNRHAYKVEMTFTQHRDWTYDYHQNGGDCSLSKVGNGSDDVLLTGKAKFALQPPRGGFAALGATGTHSRVGTMTFTTGTPNYPSADCGGPETTTTEPTDGCGPKQVNVQFATLTLVGKKVVLEWDSSSAVPDFDCPYFEGANDATSASALPTDAYRDLVGDINRKELLAAKHEVVVQTGSDEISRFQSCDTLVEPCSEGITYAAGATVRTAAKFVFTPKKH